MRMDQNVIMALDAHVCVVTVSDVCTATGCFSVHRGIIRDLPLLGLVLLSRADQLLDFSDPLLSLESLQFEVLCGNIFLGAWL